MNNNDRITILTEDFLKEVKYQLQKIGYKLKTTKQCANVQMCFHKDDNEICLTGWKKGNYGVDYSIIHTLINTDIFTMPGNNPGDYGAGMIKDRIATDEELDAYKLNLKKAKEWIGNNI